MLVKFPNKDINFVSVCCFIRIFCHNININIGRMSTRNLLKHIVGYLSVLGLDTDRVPSVSEFRKAYKDLFYLHPDKAGPESTGKFQEITEAAEIVFEFLTANGNLQPEKLDENDVLGTLVKENNLVYNKQSVCFDLTKETVDVWMQGFESILGRSKPLPSGIQFKKDSWSLDSDSPSSVTTFGTISVTFYPTTLKVHLQGSSFLDFTTFMIPTMVERMKNTNGASVAPPPDDTEVYYDPLDNATVNQNSDNVAVLIESFKRMENAVVILRTELIKKVDETIANTDKTENPTLGIIATKLDTLENLLHENKTEIAAVNEKLADISKKHNIVKLEQTSIEELANAVSNISSTKKTELDEIASAIKEVREKVDDKKLDDVVKSNQKVLEKLEGVKDLSDTFTTGLNKLEKIFEKDVFRDVANNSEQSASALNSLNKHMEALLGKFDTISIATPASKPTPKEPTAETNENVEKSDVRKVKKGKLFSSSVALGCNKRKLEYELDCELEVIETYHIVENPTATDPEKYLNNMLNSNLKEGEVDFIIISVGSNDITFLSNDKENIALNNEAIDHSTKLANTAQDVAVKLGIDVFVTERPARYDKKQRDPKGVKTFLNQSANGMLVALTSILENVHPIKLPALENLSEKDRKTLYKGDGIHLTNAGLVVLEDSLIAGIKAIYTDIEKKSYVNNPTPPTTQSRDGGRDRRAGQGGGYGQPDRNRNGSGGRGQQYHGDRQQQYGGPGQYRHNNSRNWNRGRQEPGMPDMVRDFMAFMNNGPGMYNGRGRY